MNGMNLQSYLGEKRYLCPTSFSSNTATRTFRNLPSSVEEVFFEWPLLHVKETMDLKNLA